MTTPTQVPAELIAGDTWAWTRDLADYPADTWVATWYFVKDGVKFSVDGVADGTTHTATVDAETTAALKAGRYQWRLTVSSSGVRISVPGESGWLDVLPDPAGKAVDPRLSDRVILDNVDAYLRDPSNLTAASMQIAGRTLSHYSLTELWDLREKLQAKVTNEESSGKPRRIFASFRNV